MPIYEYECQACSHKFEEWQKISDAPVRKCPKCSKRKVQKLMSATSFQLKGGGWYVTEYGGKKPSGGDEAKSSDASSGDSSPKKKSDDKTKAKSKSKKAASAD